MNKPIVVTVVSALLALAFVAAGAAKILRAGFEVEAFEKFGLPIWLMVQVGVFEVLAAVLLFVRRCALYGAIIGVAIMTVAIPTHLSVAEYPQAAMPALFLAGFLFVGYQRSGDAARHAAR